MWSSFERLNSFIWDMLSLVKVVGPHCTSTMFWHIFHFTENWQFLGVKNKNFKKIIVMQSRSSKYAPMSQINFKHLKRHLKLLKATLRRQIEHWKFYEKVLFSRKLALFGSQKW